MIADYMLREKNINLSSVKYGTLDIVITITHIDHMILSVTLITYHKTITHIDHMTISNIDHISYDYG